CRQYSNSPFTF
nr:immunoglobulin light chain junction region [Macaca mulatta]